MRTIALALTAVVFPVHSACYTPFGEISGFQTSETSFAGEGEIFLRKSPTLTQLTGPITGQVKTVNYDGLPSKIAYTFTTQKGKIGLTGFPNWTVYAEQDCLYSIDIPVSVSWGKLDGKPMTGSMLVRGVNNVCTFEEQYYVISGNICY